MIKKLALFDIDGTLIQRTGVESMPPIIKEYYDIDVKELKKYDGSTSYGILKAYLEAEGIEEPEKENQFFLALEGAGDVCKKTYANLDILPVDNVEKILKRIEHLPIYTGLVTGNTWGMAKVKMENAGLWEYFNWGAYGDKTPHRAEIVKDAIAQARKIYNTDFANENIYVIGDTKKDIASAQEVGVKSVGIATGKVSIDELAQLKPDYLFADYSNINKFLRIFK